MKIIIAIMTFAISMSICVALSVAQGGEGEESGCFSDSQYAILSPKPIRESAGIDGVIVAHAQPGGALDVISSFRQGRFCWVQVSQGWVSKTLPPDYGVADTKIKLDNTCFPHHTAYLTGKMNIRALATTESKAIKQARPGYIYSVESVFQGERYCWIQTEDGWIAVTEYVSNEISYIGVPEIHGDDSQMAQLLIDAFDWMRRYAKDYFDYVMDTKQTIFAEVPVAPGGRCCVWIFDDVGAEAYVNLDETYFWGYVEEKPTMVGKVHPYELYLSSALVHESCHHYQKDEGRWDRMNQYAREKECYKLELKMVEELRKARNAEFIKVLKFLVNRPLYFH